MNIADLVEKSPSIRHWIADLLARYRPAAKRVDLLGFPRLKAYYAAETLQSAHVVEVDRDHTERLITGVIGATRGCAVGDEDLRVAPGALPALFVQTE